MGGSTTSTLGRMLTALGVLWMGWAIVSEFVRVEPALSFLPGLIIFFVGRMMAKAGGRETGDATGRMPDQTSPLPGAEVRPVPHRPSPRPAPAERDTARAPARQPETEPEPELSLPDLEEEILDAPPPMTSKEMIAEARRRFAPRPPDDD